jgi:hypothetical protein
MILDTGWYNADPPSVGVPINAITPLSETVIVDFSALFSFLACRKKEQKTKTAKQNQIKKKVKCRRAALAVSHLINCGAHK